MKILLLSNKSPWPPKDGGSAATMSMIKGLAAKGASVTVLAFNTLKHHANIQDIPSDIAEFHFVDIDTGLKPSGLLLNLLFSDAPYTLTRFRSKEMIRKLTILLHEEFDIVQVEGLAMASYLPVIREHTRASVIFRPHNVENGIWSQLADEESNILKRKYFSIIARRTGKTEAKISVNFDGIAAMTGKDMDWFTMNGFSKPFIVSAPFTDNEEIDTVNSVPLTVCFIGALDWRPNINGLKWLVKEVWPIVIKTLPEASLHIAGRSPGNEIKEICNGLNINFYGETESSVNFLADKALMAVPLFSGGGIRMKILEGMSLGKCIVATPVAAEGIISEDRKDIFIESNAGSFAGRIVQLLSDDSLRKITGINARENVRKNYDILASAEEIMKFYTRFA
jgi:glycosyltransferase involved in cell wall biosynthesis